MSRRAILLLVALLGCLLAGSAFARKITIVQASRLELRNVTTPDGSIEEYYIITGNPAVVRVDDDEIEAQRLEYNKTRRKLRVIGAGTLKSKTETVASRDFEVDLETQGLEGSDVFISTADIDIVGISCERLPGQLEVQQGYFSPCARCGKSQDAYGFRAGEITLYPGDRLIARDVTVLVGGVPVFYLPIVVIFLNDPSRQPRFSINQNAGADGTTVALDLPFTVSDFGQGFTLLRYFEKRTPAFGFGVDLNLFNLFGGSNKSRAFFLALPPPVGSTAGVQLAYQFSSGGEFLLRDGVAPEDELPPLTYTFNLNRVDSGISSATDLRGVSGENKRTNFSLKFNLDAINYSAEVETRGVLDHRDPPNLDDPLTISAYNSGLSTVTQFLPEFRFTAKAGLLPRVGVFSLTGWGFTVGIITAPFDPFNTSARRLAGNSPLVSAGKFSVNWALGLDWQPWQNGRVNGSANFRGQYYSTVNPDGEYERNIGFSGTLNFQQSLLSNAVNFSAGYAYTISEGESPFSFDRVAQRAPNASLNLGLNASPFPWLGLGFGQRLEFTRTQRPADPLSLNLTVNPAPISLTVSSSFDWDRLEPVSYAVSLQNNVSSGVNFSVGTGYRFFDRLNPFFVPAWDDLRFQVGYRSPDAGRFSLSLGLTQNLNNGEIRGWSLNSTLILGTQENPVTLSLNQTLTPPQYTNIAPAPPQPYARLNGSFSARFGNYTVSLADQLDFAPYTYSTSTPQPPSRVSVTINATDPLPWSLQFSSAVDLATLEFYQPTLAGTVSSRSENQGGAFEFSVNFLLLLPWRNQNDWRFSSATFGFAWDVVPGFSAFANVTYSRTVVGGVFKDRFELKPIGVSFAFSQDGSPRPSIFIALYLRGTYEFSDDGSSDLPLFTPPYNASSPSSGSFPADLRPVFTLIFDQCCYSLQFTVDSTPKEGINFSFSVILPFGKQDIFTTTPNEGLKFPLLPFIPPLK